MSNAVRTRRSPGVAANRGRVLVLGALSLAVGLLLVRPTAGSAQAPDSLLRLPRRPDRRLPTPSREGQIDRRTVHQLPILWPQPMIRRWLPTSADSLPPDGTAYLVGGKLICPEDGEWWHGVPLAALRARPQIWKVEILRITGSAGICPRLIGALVIVTTREQYRRVHGPSLEIRGHPPDSPNPESAEGKTALLGPKRPPIPWPPTALAVAACSGPLAGYIG